VAAFFEEVHLGLNLRRAQGVVQAQAVLHRHRGVVAGVQQEGRRGVGPGITDCP